MTDTRDQEDRTPTYNDPTTSQATDGWQPLADVCRELGVPSRRGARWAQARHDPSQAAKRARSGGGSAQWWLSPTGAKALRIALVGEAAVIEDNRRLVTRLYEGGICVLGRLFPR